MSVGTNRRKQINDQRTKSQGEASKDKSKQRTPHYFAHTHQHTHKRTHTYTSGQTFDILNHWPLKTKKTYRLGYNDPAAQRPNRPMAQWYDSGIWLMRTTKHEVYDACGTHWLFWHMFGAAGRLSGAQGAQHSSIMTESWRLHKGILSMYTCVSVCVFACVRLTSRHDQSQAS